jgi:TatD DNase family protein
MNEPGLVRHVAEFIADLRGVPVADIARHTSANFFRLFNIERPSLYETLPA